MSKYISKVWLKMFQECFIQYFLRIPFARSKKKKADFLTHLEMCFLTKSKAVFHHYFHPSTPTNLGSSSPKKIKKTASFRPPPFKTCNCICAVAGRLPL